MGIKNLNKFLREKCSHQSIRKQKISSLENKTIVVDTSIYLYRFMAENAFMENMYLLISILLSFKINPIFIFDGKPPPEKQALLKQRRIEKKEAEQKYKQMQSTLSSSVIDEAEKQEMLMEMEQLRQQFIRITENDIQKVKRLMTAYGVSYYDAPGESDQVCAYMVKSGMAWACLSDDMDMFLYGCPIVLRNISLIHKTILVYKTTDIFSDLNMSEKAFREIMVLSGTDYNVNSSIPLSNIIELYEQYKINPLSETHQLLTFYDWLTTHTNHTINLTELKMVYRLFDVDSAPFIDDLNNKNFKNKDAQNEQLYTIMEKEGFVFTGITA